MKKLILVSIGLIGLIQFSIGQKEDISQYQRSSLYTIILNDNGLMDPTKAEIIRKTFFKMPLPEKFNDHNLSIRTFNPTDYSVTDEEVNAVLGKEEAAKPKKSGGIGGALGGIAKGATSSASAGLVDTTNTRKLPAIFFKFFDDKYIPNLMVAKWYDEKDKYDAATSSHFDMELIKQRGLYNATEFDKEIAQKTTRGLSVLADAGEELIHNTFVIGIRFNYVNKEDIARQASATSSAASSVLGGTAAAVTNTAVQTGGSVAGKGYVIKATAFLYQLDWNEAINNKFYTDYYSNKDLSQFHKDRDFKLKYVGSETEWTDIQSTVFSKKPEADLVERATVRAVDEVIAKLQKKYEPFRTKTPLLTVEPELTAKIGMKEGVEPGDKFEVLEAIQDPTTMKTTYKRVCVIKADKKNIWDNRYAADEEQAENQANGKGEVQTIKSTTFTGGNKNIYPGMLIRQID